ncbi:hypothetical protein NOR51B_697 [Luminiphilus syltensis NOR5-1B]|uniref:Uncharacterized protein n=1 Tax=Luminiphilus syltensis NOR5-1B TaxID=565045 RepID=B8KXY1_9GAMM|nr:hypothetical protein NOR51B_697 [Luminiphilus syltensis NOR5-1B]
MQNEYRRTVGLEGLIRQQQQLTATVAMAIVSREYCAMLNISNVAWWSGLYLGLGRYFVLAI